MWGRSTFWCVSLSLLFQFQWSKSHEEAITLLYISSPDISKKTHDLLRYDQFLPYSDILWMGTFPPLNLNDHSTVSHKYKFYIMLLLPATYWVLGWAIWMSGSRVALHPSDTFVWGRGVETEYREMLFQLETERSNKELYQIIAQSRPVQMISY